MAEPEATAGELDLKGKSTIEILAQIDFFNGVPMTHLRRGPDLLQAERVRLLRRRQKQAAEHLGENVDAPAVQALFESLPQRYFMENSVVRIANHVRGEPDYEMMSLDFSGGEGSIDTFNSVSGNTAIL